MSLRYAVLLVAAFLCGCSSVEMVKLDDGDQSLSNVNRAVRGQIVRMELHNGEAKSVTSVRVAPDSITWIDRRANRVMGEATANVRELSIRKAGRGAIAGLVVGAAVGAAAGGVRAVVQGDDPVSDPLGITKAEKLRVYPIAHAVYASLLSTPIGAIIGAKKSFQFETEEVYPTRVTQR